MNIIIDLGPVVQSMVSLKSLLRGQLVKCFTIFLPKILIFFVEKMREAFALQKLLTFFQQKILFFVEKMREAFALQKLLTFFQQKILAYLRYNV